MLGRLGVDPRNVEPRPELAYALLKAGDCGAALREFEQLLAIAPDHPEVRRALAQKGRP